MAIGAIILFIVIIIIMADWQRWQKRNDDLASLLPVGCWSCSHHHVLPLLSRMVSGGIGEVVFVRNTWCSCYLWCCWKLLMKMLLLLLAMLSVLVAAVVYQCCCHSY